MTLYLSEIRVITDDGEIHEYEKVYETLEAARIDGLRMNEAEPGMLELHDTPIDGYLMSGTINAVDGDGILTVRELYR